MYTHQEHTSTEYRRDPSPKESEESAVASCFADVVIVSWHRVK